MLHGPTPRPLPPLPMLTALPIGEETARRPGDQHDVWEGLSRKAASLRQRRGLPEQPQQAARAHTSARLGPSVASLTLA